MLDKLTVWIENHLAGPMAKIANIKRQIESP